jgi:hypothetical protein
MRLLLVLLTLPAAAQAQDFSCTTNNGAITITGYGGYFDAIPSTINGLPVVSIGDNASEWNLNLWSVTIPNSVTNIGDRAFGNCYNLNGIIIPDSVTSVGDGAFGDTKLSFVTLPNGLSSIAANLFNWCPSLVSVNIPNGVSSIGASAFIYCSSLTSITIPNSVTNIGGAAFAACSSLAGVTIGTNVTSIGEAAFANCYNLTSVTIPSAVASIGDNAFSACSGLTSVVIPDSVTNIGGSAFFGCSSLTTITVDALNPAYSSVDGVLFDKSQTTLIECPGGKAGSYTIPNTTASIAGGACSDCTNLSSVTIPDGVTSIGDGAFDGCSSLTKVTIGNNVTSIGNEAFSACLSLTNVYFQGNAPSFGADAFDFEIPEPLAGLYQIYDPATIYYLPGATGWGANFAGLPTMLWNPQVQPGSFGLRTNEFAFDITGGSNLVVVIEAATSLANPTWSPLQTNTLNGNPLYFTDPQWTNYPSRFYRVTWP